MRKGQDRIYTADIQAYEGDSDPYRFHFRSKRERDRFADALEGHVDSDGNHLVACEWDQVHTDAETAIEWIKALMNWKELPDAPASDPGPTGD